MARLSPPLGRLIAAGVDGIDRKLEAPPDCNDDLFDLPARQRLERGIEPLPTNLGEALDALVADELICTTLGETLTQQFLTLKRAELTAYEQHVGEWELQRYVAAF